MQEGLKDMEIPELLLLVMETSLVSLCMKIMSVLITVILYGRMIEIYAYCSVSPIPFATMTNREWGQIGNNYLKGLFALGFQGFLIMICVGIYAVLVGEMVLADNLHSAIFSLAACTCTQRPIQSQNKSRFQSNKAANPLFFSGTSYRTAAFLFAQRQRRDEPCGNGNDCRHASLLLGCHV